MTKLLKEVARHLTGGLIGLMFAGVTGPPGLLTDLLLLEPQTAQLILAAVLGVFGLVSPRQLVVAFLTIFIGWPLALVEFLAGEPIRDLLARGAQGK